MPDALSCSFCLRTSDEVTRLLAGASAHICDECVAACDAILADPSVAFPTLDGDDEAALLARLAPAASLVEAASTGLDGLVGIVRGRGVSWARIGAALGTSRQAAWERFAER